MSIISNKAISYKELLNELVNYLKSKPEYSRWKDFFESSTGQTLVELIAGYGALMSYRLHKARAESYLKTANLRSSIISQAESLGYSVLRGYPPAVEVTFIPSADITYNKFDIVGSYESYDLIVDKDVVYYAGSQYTERFYISKVNTLSLTVSTSDFYIFRFVGDNISEVVRVLLNGVEVPISNESKSLLEDKWLVITSPFGVDVTHMNTSTGVYNYSSGDTLELQYLELIEDISNFDINKVVFSSIDGVSSINYMGRQDPEDNESIRINAPLYNEVQTVVRARNDFVKLIETLDPRFIDTNQIDDPNSTLVIDVTYLTNDGSLLTTAEKDNLVQQLRNYLPYGYPDPVIVDPVSQSLTLDITLTIYAKLDPTDEQINNDIAAILSNYEKKLGINVDVEEVTKQLYQLEYVKSASVVVNTGVTALQWNEYIWTINYNLVKNYV